MGRFLGAYCPPMSVIPPSRDMTGVREASQEAPPELAGSPFETPAFIYVGRLEAAKGLDRLLGAFAAACAGGMDAHLIISGEGRLRESLEAMARQRGIGHRVFFIGPQENPYPLMSRSRALVSTSHYEGGPGGALEALALALPVVAFNCSPDLSDLLQDGESGALIDDGDERVLAPYTPPLCR